IGTLATTSCAGAAGDADLVLTGGRIWTGVPGDSVAEAIAIRDGRVVLVGSAAAAEGVTGRQTQVIDLDGRLVVPGFADDHTHFMSGGFQLASVDLRDAASPEEFARRIGSFAAELPAERW